MKLDMPPLLRTLMWCNLVACLGLLAAYLWPLPVLERNRVARTMADIDDSLPITPDGDIEQILERPIFHQNRRKPKATVAAPAPTPRVTRAEAPFDLVGVLGSSATGATAYLLHKETGETISVRVGEAAAGWTVVSVGNQEVVIEADGIQRTLRLANGG